MLAIRVAQVDAVSGGRVELGLGTGWYEAAHRAYGIPFPGRYEELGAQRVHLQVWNMTDLDQREPLLL